MVDVHLGTLARYLRLVGFDTLWRNDLGDAEIVRRALGERRIVLTRDIGILRHGDVTHGYWLRATDPEAQLEEVIRALDLGTRLRPYTRCLECNGLVRPMDRRDAHPHVPLQVFLVYRDFTRCEGCGRVYWPGSHQRRLDEVVARARAAGDSGPPENAGPDEA